MSKYVCAREYPVFMGKSSNHQRISRASSVNNLKGFQNDAHLTFLRRFYCIRICVRSVSKEMLEILDGLFFDLQDSMKMMNLDLWKLSAQFSSARRGCEHKLHTIYYTRGDEVSYIAIPCAKGFSSRLQSIAGYLLEDYRSLTKTIVDKALVKLSTLEK